MLTLLKSRHRLALSGLVLALMGMPAWSEESTPAAAPQKVLRYAFRIAETGFDPAQISDTYSRIVATNIFDAPLIWDFLAQPTRFKPNTVVALPTVSSDFTTFTFKLKPGILFSDAPEFKGAKRELVAADYVYSWKRHYDPAYKSPNLYILENAKVLGLSELRKEALASKKPFDYDREVEGLKVLDRYTFQLKLAQPRPRMLYEFTDGSAFGAVAREVIEAHGTKAMEHPVGTGPFMLAAWRRASRIELVRNPNFREMLYDEQAPEGDALAQQAVQRLKGRRLPMIDKVEIDIIEENQPRWLAFLAGDHDLLDELPPEFVPIAIPNNVLAPNLRKQQIQMVRYPKVDVSFMYFNMQDPVVGGYEPPQVALRRAISLGYDSEREIRLVRRGQAIVAQGPITPATWGYRSDFKTEMGDYDPARAKALLDLAGYRDRDGDGWREQPNGEPLVLQIATEPDQLKRQIAELWKKSLNALGLKSNFKIGKWPENLKAANAGKLQMWGVAWVAGSPDGDTFLALGDGSAQGQANKSRFDLPAFNRLYQAQKSLPDGPERMALMTEAQRLMVAYAPYKFNVHRVFTDLAHPWLIGFHRNPFLRDSWRWVDIDLDARKKALGS